jgi:hypothetical protein
MKWRTSCMRSRFRGADSGNKKNLTRLSVPPLG